MTRHTASTVLAIPLICLIVPFRAATGQDPTFDAHPDRWVRAELPLLSPDHWAVRAVHRAADLGLLDGFAPAQRALSPDVVEADLAEAARRAALVDPSLRDLTAAWVRRFAHEFPHVASGDGEAGVLRGVALRAGFARRIGLAAPGRGQAVGRRTGASPLPDQEGAEFAGTLRLSLGGRVGVSVEPAVHATRGLTLRRWAVRTVLGPLALAIGRQPVAYGPAEGGGIVLSGVAPIDGLEIGSAAPLRLPGWLHALGPVAVHTFIGRLDEPRHPGRPWLWSSRLVLRPHPRLTLAGSRAAIFGGDSVGAPMTPRTVLRMLIGETLSSPTNGFENQMAAVEVRYRLPTERLLPLVLYVEAGMEDFDVLRGLRDSPGFVAGARVPALPGAPTVQIGVERAYFGESCCGNGMWYRHFSQVGGWAVQTGPLGHPLGGNGDEWLMFATADLLDSRLWLTANAFLRERGAENLYAPERQGRSTGFAGSVAWRPAAGIEVWLRHSREAGEAWTARRTESGVSAFF